MKRGTLIVVVLVVALLLGGAFAAFRLLSRQGFSAREKPLAVEAFVARRLRRLAIPAEARGARNPVASSPEVLREARAHFADHCAICHANDGSGDTEIGGNLYPPAPDMREDETQSLSDGEIFFIIHNGIRFTGMPAWGPEDPDEDTGSWKLVHFIRHLPDLTPEEIAEMKRLNPKSAHERDEEDAIRDFLDGRTSEEPAHDH